MRASWLGLSVLLLAVVATVGYVAFLFSQGSAVGQTAYLVMGLILLPAAGCALGTSSWVSNSVRPVLLGWAALTLLAMTVIGAMSIGIFVLPAAILAAAAMVIGARSVPAMVGLPTAGLGAFLGVATVFAFLTIEPYLPPDCPQQAGRITGSSGWPRGLFTPALHVDWVCQDGRLVSWQTSTASGDGGTFGGSSSSP
jgi:hypothetical protein